MFQHAHSFAGSLLFLVGIFFAVHSHAVNESLSIASYGAMSKPGFDNTASILAAIVDARRLGKDVHVPAGTFEHRSFTYEGVRLAGTGTASILLARNPSDARINLTGSGTALADLVVQVVQATRRNGDNDAVRNINASNFLVENVTISGPEGTCIFTTNSHDGRILRNRCLNSWADGIHTTGGSFNIVVSGNVVRNSGDDMIAVVGYNGQFAGQMKDARANHNILIQDNDVADQAFGRGITVVGGYDITIQRNKITDARASAGIAVIQEYEASTWITFGSSNIKIVNNVLRNVGGTLDNHAGIELVAASDSIHHVLVQGNIINGVIANDGVRTDARDSSLIHDISVISNQFNEIPRYAILRWMGTNVFCSGNTLAGAPYAGVGCDGTSPSNVTGAALSYNAAAPAPLPPAPGPDASTPTTTALAVISSPSGTSAGEAPAFDLTYQFEARQALPTAMTVFVHLIDSSGRIALQDDHRPPVATTAWSGRISYSRRVQVPPNPPVGGYSIRLGLYDESTGRRLALTPGPGVVIDASEPLRYVAGRLTTAAASEVTVLKATLLPSTPVAGSSLNLTYRFSGGGTGVPLQVFMHVIDTTGRILYQDDHLPPRQTNDWAAGQTLTYTRSVAVPAAFNPGHYRIVAGLYDPASGERRALLFGTGVTLDTTEPLRYEIAAFDVR